MKRIIEFLKPCACRIVIFILLVIFLIPFVEFDTGIRCIRAPCPSSGFASITEYLSGEVGSQPILGFHYEYLILGSILAYLLACLLVEGIKFLMKKAVC